MGANDIKINLDNFKDIYPHCKIPTYVVNVLNELLPAFNINTVESVAGFLAQTGHESGGWRTFKENLNYSENALNAVFGKYFRRVDASIYARKPEKIANLVYANRMGNGDESSGDGWKYRGHGAIQLTGFNNHNGFNEWLDENNYSEDVVKNPDLISDEPELLVLSAIYFWNRENLTDVCNTGDIKKCTRIINGGYSGLEERTELFKRWLSVLD